jgi:hypothetical protein
MNIDLPSTNDMTIVQLLEQERSLRIMASTALTRAEASALLALAEVYETFATERQAHETKEGR